MEAGDAVDIVVYARSRDPDDRGFLERIGRPALELVAAGRRLDPVGVEHGRPFSGSQLIVDADGGSRWRRGGSATLAFRFRLTPADTGSAAIDLNDGEGKMYRLDVDLARFR